MDAIIAIEELTKQNKKSHIFFALFSLDA